MKTEENRRISNFKGLVTLTLDRIIRHTVVHHSSTSTYIPNFIGIGKTFCGRTDVRVYGWTFEPHIDIIRSTLRSRPKNKQYMLAGKVLKTWNIYMPINVSSSTNPTDLRMKWFDAIVMSKHDKKALVTATKKSLTASIALIVWNLSNYNATEVFYVII